ncbi:MAG TPA: ABC transporter permease [Bryobacteraceae bacterium]|nr:ABC transporter permease [Bryobacteraceae bacterium]
MIQGIYAVIVLDLKRFWLDRARIVTGLMQPLLYLFVFGAGLGASSVLGAGNYQRFIFPGTMALTLFMTATFGAISIVFDRQIGFFKAVLVAPVPRTAIALGKIAAGALQAFGQGLVLLPFAPLAGVHLGPLEIVQMLGGMLLASVTFAAVGVAVAVRFNSVTVFPIVSNVIILPLFFMSGAMYPLTMAPRWMQLLAHADPVAYAVDLMRGALLDKYFFPVPLSIGVLAAFIAVLAWMATRAFQKGEDDSILGKNAFPWRR